MFVVDDRLCHGLEALNDQLLDLLIAIIDLLLSVPAHQIQFHASQVPFAAQLVVIIVGGLLDGNIC